jgi:hypothetical protein
MEQLESAGQQKKMTEPQLQLCEPYYLGEEGQHNSSTGMFCKLG